MTQSKIISSTDAMFAIVDASNLRHDGHCPLEDVLRNILRVYESTFTWASVSTAEPLCLKT